MARIVFHSHKPIDLTRNVAPRALRPRHGKGSVIGFPETIILINILRTGLQSFSFAARALKGRGRGRVHGKEENKTTDYTGRERWGGFWVAPPPFLFIQGLRR